MGFVEDLQQIGLQPYDSKSALGRDQPIFDVLERLRSRIESWCPPGYTVKASRGVGSLPDGLWIAALNDEVTNTPTAGIYLVYLFDTARTAVSLSLNQGIEDARVRARLAPGITRNGMLRAEALSIRTLLPESDQVGYSQEIRLGAGTRPTGYEAGNILSHTWALAALPSEATLRSVFDEMLDLYERTVELKEVDLLIHPGSFHMPARSSRPPSARAPVFAPKNSADYLTNARYDVEPQVRRRSHEDLVRRLGEHAQTLGWVAATNYHPIDLTLTRSDQEILVEAKILDPRHPAGGVRESIGQLFEYKKFLRAHNPHLRLLAAYDVAPPGAHLELLDDLGIVATWSSGASFAGPGAEQLLSASSHR